MVVPRGADPEKGPAENRIDTDFLKKHGLMYLPKGSSFVETSLSIMP
jgi:hypothetical protein